GRRHPPDSAMRPRAPIVIAGLDPAIHAADAQVKPGLTRVRDPMFDSLSERLNGILDRLTRRGALSEADVEAALREVRRALLEADVALDVGSSFTDQV